MNFSDSVRNTHRLASHAVVVADLDPAILFSVRVGDYRRAMPLTVVIPTLNSESELPALLSLLVPAAVSGLVRQVVIADGGSSDHTREFVEAAGADLVTSEKGRGQQLKRGAEAATSPWLLFLHADTLPAAGWEDEVRPYIQSGNEGVAATFRFRLDDRRLAARGLEWAVAVRSRLLALPYGDQGLLISRHLYDEVGGYRPIPIMEDVDIVRRIGRKRLAFLRHAATTSAARYRRDGYLRRVLRNASCLGLWLANVPPDRIARLYG